MELRHVVAAGDKLQELAQSRLNPEHTIAYGELCKILGIKIPGPDWDSEEISRILGALNEEDHSSNRPFRSVLVVNANDGKPGKSFYKAMSALRYGGVEIPKECREDLRRFEYMAVIAFWQNQQPC